MTSTANESEQGQQIVVGVDGSVSSQKALAWAVKQAVLTSAPLTVLATWTHSMNLDRSDVLAKVEDHETSAKLMLENTIDAVLGSEPTIPLTRHVVEGHPSTTLVDESKSAALLVVGSRGHGELAGILLGSVSQFVVANAHCPVVVVREGHDLEEG